MSRTLLLACFAGLLGAVVPASAQIVGGGFSTLQHWDGPTNDDNFGHAVAGLGDLNGDGVPDVAVGAPESSPAGPQGSGSVQVFSGADGSLLFHWFGVANGDRFGIAVADAGDLDGDGTRDVLVGAPFASPGGLVESGSAFAFSGASGALLRVWSGAGAGDLLGYSLDGAGDLDGDGHGDVILGAPGENISGAVHVYSGATTLQLYLWKAGPVPESFGGMVAGIGDLDGDGVPDLALSRSTAVVDGMSDAGKVSVRSGRDGSLLREWSGSAPLGIFGTTVVGPGDIDRDGHDDVLVGAPFAPFAGQPIVGSATLFSGSDGSVLFAWGGASPLGIFGISLAGAGDADGDGWLDLLVGSPSASPGGVYMAGSASAFSGKDGSLIQRWDGQQAGYRIGTSVGGAGDLDGDGLGDMIVGRHSDPSGPAPIPGSVEVLSYHPFLQASEHGSSAASGTTLQLDLDFPSASAGDNYRVVLSATGTGPTQFGVEVPLTLDALALETFAGSYPVAAGAGLQGQLDGSGDASASLTSPAGLPPSLVGLELFMVALANKPGQLPEFSSLAITLELVP